MSKQKDLLGRFGANLAESMGAGRKPAQPAPAPAAGSSRHDGCTRLRAAAEIELARIIPDPNQPRTEFEPDAITRLANSMKTHGQLAPIAVRWAEALGKYLIVTGERRYRAALEAGRATIDAVIIEGERTESQILEMQLIENALREDLKPIEQARAYKSLMVRNDWSALRLSEVLHINNGTIARALALLELPEPVQVKVEAGELPPATAYEISKLDDPDDQAELVERVAAEQLSRAETAAAVKRVAGRSKGRGASKGKSTKASKAPARKIVERTFRAAGCRVVIENRRGLDDATILAALDEIRASLMGAEGRDAA